MLVYVAILLLFIWYAILPLWKVFLTIAIFVLILQIFGPYSLLLPVSPWIFGWSINLLMMTFGFMPRYSWLGLDVDHWKQGSRKKYLEYQESLRQEALKRKEKRMRKNQRRKQNRQAQRQNQTS